MNISQKKWSLENGWESIREDTFDQKLSNLVIVFGSRKKLSEPKLFEEIKAFYPTAQIIINSTSGEIIDTQVNDDTLSVTAIQFNNTAIETHCINIENYRNSKEAGKSLAKLFNKNELSNLLIISDGQLVNGSELIEGLEEIAGKNITISGGLAGDGSLFKKTLVGLNCSPEVGNIVAIGFYGDYIQISHGSVGGWDSFGQERKITSSKGNILYELDNEPALDIYKRYLGKHAKDLPMSALLFPLSIKIRPNEEPVVRTILAVNEKEKSLTFAGNVPEGCNVRLMKANYDRLIEGASSAAEFSMKINDHPELAILISCVGRKLVLNQRIEEEIEAVRDVFGKQTAITGFYSYGEISPITGIKRSELHNQTMTITTFSERKDDN